MINYSEMLYVLHERDSEDLEEETNPWSVTVT